MDTDIRIRAVGPPQRDLLIGMYDRFEPLGLALGLPPYTADARRDWIGVALGHKLNLAALSPAEDVMGHCFLVPGEAGSAELALFVHQEFRRRGVGTALVKAALHWGGVAGLRRVWSLTSCDNRTAIRLQEKCGFRLKYYAFPAAGLEIDLPCGDVAQALLPAASALMPTLGLDTSGGRAGRSAPHRSAKREKCG